MIKVEYIDHCGDDLMVANVARVSFDKWKDELDAKDSGLIRYLASHEHTSPFRHNAVILRCHAPIWLARQLGKHQVGMSWNETSRRYVKDNFEFYVPEYREAPEGSIKQGSGGNHIDNELFQEATVSFHAAAMGLYDSLIERGVAPEQARGILPQNMMTSWVWTGSLYAWAHMYRLRVDGHAQVEAQQFAKEVDTVMTMLFPESWLALKVA